MSVLTSMKDPRAPTLAVVEEERKTLCNEEELTDMRSDTKKKEEHIYPVMSPAQPYQAVTAISAVFKLVLVLFFGPITLTLSPL